MKLEITQEPRDKKGKEYRFDGCVEMKIDGDRDGVRLSLESLNQKPPKSNTRYDITVTLCLTEISEIVRTVTRAARNWPNVHQAGREGGAVGPSSCAIRRG